MTRSGREAALLANSRDIILVLDESGHLVYVNAAAERIAGYDADDLVGRNAFELIPESDREAVWEAFTDVISSQGDAKATVEHRLRTVEGAVVWLESRMAHLADDAIGGYVVSSRDVTDRKRAEQRRQETEAQLQRLAANASDVLWLFSGDWSELIFVNGAYEDIYGRSTDALADDPQDFMNAVYPPHREQVQDAMARLSAGEPADFEYRVNEEEGYSRWVWVKASPVVEDGRVVQIAGFSRDVTQRREREGQLQAMDRVLRHNLRNDLNLVLGHAQEAKQTVAADSPAADHLNGVLQSAEKLLATADKGRHVVELLGSDESEERFDLASVVRSAADTIRERYPEATISVDVPESLPVCSVNKLSFAVEELLDNAVSHGEEPVSVRTATTGRWVDLRVVDEGPPIPQEELLILEGEAEPMPLRHGSGLGLRLVSWVGRCSGGNVSFSRVGGENCVTLRLPRSPK